MNGSARHYFPGNNTPGGFFSYYDSIMDQREAKRIWCIKGGPGTGKSSFMKGIGETMLAEGHDVDFLHCSSDNNSLDGIIIKDLSVAMMDGTAPHVIDPKNPGAVDTIINLGEFWSEEGIRKNRSRIIESNEKIADIFRVVYHYLLAAESMYDSIAQIRQRDRRYSADYGIAMDIIGDELGSGYKREKAGKVRKFFVGAITPQGLINYIPGLIDPYKKVYVMNTEVGGGTENITSLIMEAALCRGFDAEAFYCPMKPEKKLEHLLIPELSLAIVTSNSYHSVGSGNHSQERIEINLTRADSLSDTSLPKEMAEESSHRMEELITRAVYYLGKAKQEHDLLESFYIPNMDFKGIEELRRSIEEQIRKE